MVFSYKKRGINILPTLPLPSRKGWMISNWACTTPTAQSRQDDPCDSTFPSYLSIQVSDSGLEEQSPPSPWECQEILSSSGSFETLPSPYCARARYLKESHEVFSED